MPHDHRALANTRPVRAATHWDWDPGRPGWLRGARRALSPNHDARPPGCRVELVVLHGISLPAGQFGGPYIEQLFGNCLAATAHPSFADLVGLRVSSHFLLRRDGEALQFVPVHLRAWHAGVSVYRGRPRCNDFSVGIELEGTDTVAYTEAQYAVLRRLLSLLRQRFPQLGAGDVVGHQHIAPGRKTDPGPAFDWQRLEAGS